MQQIRVELHGEMKIKEYGKEDGNVGKGVKMKHKGSGEG